ncbi:sarcosine oxidase subunit gamma [Siccirubricoccus deserti]|uniref:Sarcosine oxidase subunit gamma n=1 Tax=Siccirubricoccus deserti TaxID=2013562 RepID=A0A9X0UDK1_9PROT|nr:sarcosine oxidase subunit gamma family protein [Siccirubricoccus deserti]MBC4016512.1 sarcosine oxidase subunit gamma [Siccirubricoccus deserti]GGC49677.1 sarcosine oxidase subunit gamma [Siccirubricoccus deserti]
MAEVTLHPLPPLVRISLRCGPEARVPLGAAFGVALPEVPLCAEAAGARAALWLGPDEWLLLAGDAVDLAALEAARGAAPASIVEVSAGRAGFALEGAAAPLLLAEGCPLDLYDPAFPPGACTRTLFGKVEVVLWRRGAARWHIETTRSLAPHLGAHLAEALADLDG